VIRAALPPWAMLAPPPPLRAAVQCVWFTSGATDGQPRQRVLPNGVIELIFALDDAGHAVIEGDAIRTVRRCWIAGLQRGPLTIAPAVGGRLVGVRFRPGGLPALWRLPASELTDKVSELDGFDDTALLALRDRLAHAATLSDLGAALTAGLVDRLAATTTPARVRQAVAALRTHPESGIGALADRLGITHQHLVRVFRDRVGVPPRLLARILRFDGAVRLAQAGAAPPRWSELATAAGYYDQAHLIAEFRTFAGTTPTAYWERRIPGAEHLEDGQR